MKRIILLSLYIIFFIYSTAMILFGKTGVYASARLNSRIQLLAENMEEMEVRESKLTQILNTLRFDPVAVRIEARGMGLYSPEEQVIYLNNSGYTRTLPDIGRIIALEPLKEESSGYYRILGFIIGLLSLTLGLIIVKVKNASYAQHQ
ncbi:MAG: hypothetical protein B0D92_08200 [Spirochaeta sp. LUC14_002_19_P3]|nr:MAG: hypothetical protein B0D92_08200 [Spirochaeta sp. LUC14_002_19_P3]